MVKGFSKIEKDSDGLPVSVVQTVTGQDTLSAQGLLNGVIAGYWFAAAGVTALPDGSGYVGEGHFYDYRPASKIGLFVPAVIHIQTADGKVGYDIAPSQGVGAHADPQ